MISKILEHDHEQLAELLHPLMSDLLKHDAGKTFELLDFFWARLAVHIRAENLCLFPAILSAPRELFSKDVGVPSFDETKTILEQLKTDHNFFMDELAKGVKTLRELLAKEKTVQHVDAELTGVQERVNAVSLRLESHNALEEDQVYKWPSLILNAASQQDLEVALKRELENLPPRFAKS
jgi:hypothetical protein